MHANGNGDNILCELAQTMSAGGHHATATALRKLAQAGYTSLEQVDGTSDWILLQIPGMGTRRLADVRLLSRSNWQPPSLQAIEATGWFLSAALFALRYWPLEALASLVRGTTRANVSGGPVEKKLALDVFSQATEKAQRHCESEELVQALWQTGTVCSISIRPVQGFSSDSGVQPHVLDSSQVQTPASERPAAICDHCDPSQDSDHFAHPRLKRVEIVRRYWIARDNRDIKNKDAWARSNYQITGKTLLCYEREFQSQKQAILAAADGG